jgi:thiamine pyrophosphate-dependent acetolactate synthase large subunit-like protein
MNGAQAFVAALRRAGVDLVFGIPGVHTLPLYNALYDAPDIRPIVVRHESGASFAADGYARVTGRPGVCVAVPGPGATNMSTGVGAALVDSVPMVVVTSQIPEALLGRSAVHDFDVEALYRPLVKASLRAATPDQVGPTMDQAFELATSGRPGPVQVTLWVDALSQEASDSTSYTRLLPRPESSLSEAAAAATQRAAELINRSDDLVVVIGDGAVDAGAVTFLTQLASRRGGVVATSVSARGAVPEDDPVSLGPICWESAADVLRQADCCLAVGTRFSEISTLAWSVPIPARLIRVDVDPDALERNYPPEVAIQADARACLEAMLPLIEPRGAPTAIQSACAATQQRLADARAAIRDSGSATPIHPRWLTLALRDAFPPDTVFATDGSATEFWLTEPSLPLSEPRSFLLPEVFQTMGYALPAAIGARLGAPDRPLVCVTGDGSLVMVLSELATAVALHVPLIVVIFDDGFYNALRIYQDGLYDGRRIGVELENPDFVALASAMGAQAVRVSDPSDLPGALAWAQTNDGVTVVDVIIDHEPLPNRYERRVKQMRDEVTVRVAE